jgi:flavodoxin I
MKALVVYDSAFGNTEKIARAIGDALKSKMDVEVCRVSDTKQEELTGLNLLIVGSPTQAFRATSATNRFLKDIPSEGLRGIKVAAFDTRIATSDIKSRVLRFLVNLFGYAAEPVSKKLSKKAGEVVIVPAGFLVADTEGPLKEGQLERAVTWAKRIIETMS